MLAWRGQYGCWMPVIRKCRGDSPDGTLAAGDRVIRLFIAGPETPCLHQVPPVDWLLNPWLLYAGIYTNKLQKKMCGLMWAGCNR